MSNRSGKLKAARAVHDNKQLRCSICGFQFLHEWMEIWLMKIHFEIDHDTDQVEVHTVSKNAHFVPSGEPIDMATSQELTKMLAEIRDAAQEAKAATRDAHAATKELKQAVKAHETFIRDEIDKAVQIYMDNVTHVAASAIRAEASRAVTELMEKISARFDV